MQQILLISCSNIQNQVHPPRAAPEGPRPRAWGPKGRGPGPRPGGRARGPGPKAWAVARCPGPEAQARGPGPALEPGARAGARAARAQGRGGGGREGEGGEILGGPWALGASGECGGRVRGRCWTPEENSLEDPARCPSLLSDRPDVRREAIESTHP